MSWLVRVLLSHDSNADAGVVTSQLWDLGTTGVAELATSEGTVLVAGFDDAAAAHDAADAHDGSVERYDPESWSPPEPRDVVVGDVELHITPGRAFGHGEHPTTRLLLEALVERPAKASVLDLGCGTGVLAIAAAALGATAVTAVDVDPEAIEVTLANAAANDVSVRVEHTEPPTGVRYRTVMANLLLSDLRRAAPVIDSALGLDRGSRLLVSGFLADQEAEVQMLFAGLDVAEQWSQGEWVALELRRP